ncbi:MAG: Asp-tRNA(Asn)/Glu-tRNA(Gln) amidotransferase subunit GatB [Verrucomicrobia bacterium]|nr:Asp-tRNA(Asn)/Glu-tRNA(Gln) amidotransferase subunit GatB [Verrucomicrobiota bacterium]
MYLVSIGLEVHVQLRTRSKMFCACAVEYGAEPNTRTCPVCLGLPGALPVMNGEAIKLTLLTGLMLGCRLASFSKFDRKNYFYPDMPKNYQISQYDLPFCSGGAVELYDLAYPKDAQKRIAQPGKSIRLTRIHLEEDVAKSTHFETGSGIDFNRAGTPLMEIVSEPDIASPEEAFAYLTSLKQTLLYGGVSDADMEKGQLRCDCNVSVRPAGQEQLGTKIEIKNMNTISGVRRALAYEIERQIEEVSAGRTLQQETRGWDDAAGATYVMRVKESAHDYRYFPDPDLPPVDTTALRAAAEALLPELPGAKRRRYEESLGLSTYDATTLASDLSLSRYFEGALAAGQAKPKALANWVLNDLNAALAAAEQPLTECRVQPAALAGLLAILESGQINGKQAKEVFAEMFASGREAAAIVQERGLEQVSDTGALEQLCAEVVAANPKVVADFRGGNAAALNFLKGQVMKLSKGKANPAIAGEILARQLAAGA